MTSVWTDEPAFAEGWLGGARRSWAHRAEGHWSEALTGASCVAGTEVASWGGRVVRLPMVEGVSTTDLVERIRSRITAPKGKEDR